MYWNLGQGTAATLEMARLIETWDVLKLNLHWPIGITGKRLIETWDVLK